VTHHSRYEAFDLLATLVALAQPDGTLLFVNSGFEAVVGQSRRALVRTSLFDRFADASALRETLIAVAHNEIATGPCAARAVASPAPTRCWWRCWRSSSRPVRTARSARSTRSRPTRN
jgi:hypothetical protein